MIPDWLHIGTVYHYIGLLQPQTLLRRNYFLTACVFISTFSVLLLI